MAEMSENFGFVLPSRDGDDIADINQISDNFRIIDEKVPSKEDLENFGSAVSPTVKVTETDNGHKVSITDVNGTKSFDVLNGEKGDRGEQGVSGVYVGSGDMPEGYNVQIDPDGEALDMNTLATKEYVDSAVSAVDPQVNLSNYPTKEELAEDLAPIQQSITDMSVDYIVERGTTDIWTWEKWNSGKAVCWGIFDVYYQDVNKLTTTVDFPFEIIGDIFAQVTKIAGTDAYDTLYATTCYEATSTQIIIALCNSGEEFGECDTLKLSVYVIGKWN